MKRFITSLLVATLTIGSMVISPVAMIATTSFYNGAIAIGFEEKPDINLRPYRGEVKPSRMLKTWLAIYIRGR